MSAHGWNSGYANVFHLDSSPTLLACRICYKIFLNTCSLIEYYESHQEELAARRQDHLQNGNFTNNPFQFQPRLSPSWNMQQRHHPYFPNGYRTLHLHPQVRVRNPFLVSSRTLFLWQPNSTLGSVPSVNPFAVPGRGAILQSAPQPEEPQRSTAEQIGLDESADKATVWYLSRLEQPTLKTIDLLP